MFSVLRSCAQWQNAYCAYCIDRGSSDVTIKPSRKFRRHGNVRVSSANDLARQRLTRTAYPPPRVPCVRGAARATVDKAFSKMGSRVAPPSPQNTEQEKTLHRPKATVRLGLAIVPWPNPLGVQWGQDGASIKSKTPKNRGNGIGFFQDPPDWGGGALPPDGVRQEGFGGVDPNDIPTTTNV